MFIARRKLFFPVGAGLLILFLGYNVFFRNPQSDLWPSSWQHTKHGGGSKQSPKIDPKVLDDEDYFWRKIPTHYPVQSMTPLPTGIPLKLPKIQTTFKTEDPKSQETRLERQDTVKKSFLRCWEAYKAHAWLQDEVTPISASSKNTFGGWGATLVDSLDTLYIMGLSDEFELAVSAAANISFERSSLTEINAFETTIRYLGGFLAAYDLSGDQRLLQKAREVGDMLYVAFDTPNRMPITRWEVGRAAQGEKQEASSWALVAEVGSLCMEFTRLSLITGNPKWFDATERIMLALKEQQMDTQLP
ncbi:seven-hairpin glycosidase, partial [Xylariaceae sp. FL0662B]